MVSTNHSRSPLFSAQNSGRYERQSLIAEYEQLAGCRLVVMIGEIFNNGVTFLEELIHEAAPSEDLHLILASPGGNGEAAVRLARSMQARCRELTVIIPTEAKSAATLLCLGAHHIVMAPFSDLGPVDPQLWDGERFVAAKDIVAAVDDAVEQVQAHPNLSSIYEILLSDMDAVSVQEARSALGRSHELLDEALRSNPDRTPEAVNKLRKALRQQLIDRPQSHAALFSADNAEVVGLPVIRADLDSKEWRMLWRLWAMYFALGPNRRIYESRNASQVLIRPPADV